MLHADCRSCVTLDSTAAEFGGRSRFMVDFMGRRVPIILTVVTAIGLAAWALFPDTLIARNTDLDEGVYLMVARLLHRGHDVHTFFFDQFWFFPKILATSFKFFGDSLLVGRLTAFAFALAGVFGAAALTYQLEAKWSAATAAILICAASPLYIRQSRMVMADVPATACIVWALVFVFLFRKNRQRLWLLLSGVCASASLMLKPFTVGFLVTIIIVVFAQRTRHENGRLKLDPQILYDILIFAAGGIIAAAPCVDFLHPIEEYRRTVGFHFAERNWLIKRVDDRWRGLVGFTRLDVPLVVFAIPGIVVLRPLSAPLVALLIGELLTIAILFAMPPWLHHYALILPAMIVFTVLGFNRGLAQFKAFIAESRNRATMHSASKFVAALFGCALVISVIDLPWLARLEHRARWPRLIHLEPAVRYAQQTFPADEYLITDDALMVYLADRLIPPPAINFTFADVLKFDPTSFARFEQVLRENNVGGVIVTSRFNHHPRLMSWLEQNFTESVQVGSEQNDELVARIFSKRREAR